MEETKKYLESIRNTDREIDEKIEVLKRMKQSMTSIQSSQIKEINVMGGKNLTFEDQMAKYIDYSREINENVDKLVDRKMEVFHEIDSLDKEVHRTVLIARYVNCKNWEEVSESMNYEERHVRRIYEDAVKELSLRCPSMS